MKKKLYYLENYDCLDRWIGYWYQIESVLDLNPKTVLEIGPGNKTVSDYLKKRSFRVRTCDARPFVKPDFMSDVREIKAKDNSFDLVLCCEVLEHIPFEGFSKAVSEIYRVAKRFAVISIPQRVVYYSVTLRLPFWGTKNLFIKRPFYQHKKISKYHFWEIDNSEHSLKKLRKIFRSVGFKILGDKIPILQSYHRIFLLKK